MCLFRQVSHETNQHFLAPCHVSRVARFREFSDVSVERQIDEEGILQMATEQGRQSGSLLTSLHWTRSGEENPPRVLGQVLVMGTRQPPFDGVVHPAIPTSSFAGRRAY